jgi:Holliday junction resolvase
LAKVLISLATGQMVVNLRGHREIQPDVHLILQSRKTQLELQWFTDLLSDDDVRGRKYEENNPEAFLELINTILREYRDHEVFLNFTGGPKYISFIALQAVLQVNGRAFYVDSEKQRLHFLHQSELYFEAFTKKIRNRDILRLHGQVVAVGNSRQIPESDAAIATWLFSQRKNYAFAKAFSQLLNEFSITITRTETDVENKLSKNGTLTPANHKLKLTAEHGRYTIDNPWGENHTFSHAELMFVFTGQWFEAYVFQILKKAKLFDQLQQNVVLKNKQGKDKNEFDILGNRNGWLYYFECKSGWVGTEDIDKMASYQKLFTGRFTIAILVSFFPLREEVKIRAGEHKIYCLDREDKLKRIADIIMSYQPHEL